MRTILKKTLAIILFLSCIFCLNAETKTYNVVSYAWGSTPKSAPSSRNIAWGKMKKVNYQITFDDNEKNPTMVIQEKNKTYKYKIRGQVWGQREFNHTNAGWTINRCFVEDEFGHTNGLTIRENADGRMFVYLIKNGIVYAYGTSKDNELLGTSEILGEQNK